MKKSNNFSHVHRYIIRYELVSILMQLSTSLMQKKKLLCKYILKWPLTHSITHLIIYRNELVGETRWSTINI